MARIATAGFRNSTSRIFFPALDPGSTEKHNDEDEIEWRRTRVSRIITQESERKPNFVVVEVPDDAPDDDAAEGTVVGYAGWERPMKMVKNGASENAERKEDGDGDQEMGGGTTAAGAAEAAFYASLPPVPGFSQERVDKTLELMERESKRCLGPDGHSNMWYLSALCVDPAHNRRGIGKMLLQRGLEMATTDGTGLFLFATEEGRPLYLKHGFKCFGETTDIVGCPTWPMLWTPPAHAGNGEGSNGELN